MTPVVLASKSAIRARILQNAGVNFTVRTGDVDEDVLKTQLLAQGGTPQTIAQSLALAKAQAVEAPGAVVIGADQTLEFQGELVDKAKSHAEARDRLAGFRGHDHQLHAGVAMVCDGAVLWSGVMTSHLWVRDFSDAFLDRYVERAGGGLIHSVGAYEYEGLGAQLFDRVDGDYYAILGLPLMPVLKVLRDHGAVLT